MVLELLDGLGVKRLRLAGHAERAVVHVAAGAAGDLGHFRRRQVTELETVELAA